MNIIDICSAILTVLLVIVIIKQKLRIETCEWQAKLDNQLISDQEKTIEDLRKKWSKALLDQGIVAQRNLSTTDSSIGQTSIEKKSSELEEKLSTEDNELINKYLNEMGGGY